MFDTNWTNIVAPAGPISDLSFYPKLFQTACLSSSREKALGVKTKWLVWQMDVWLTSTTQIKNSPKTDASTVFTHEQRR